MSSTLTVYNESKTFPNRRIIIKLTKAHGREYIINETGNLCAIKVNINRTYGGIDPSATISICNLPPDLIERFMTKVYSKNFQDTVSVYAGYENIGSETTELPLIFYGNILWAVVSSTRPDMWFEITCNENFYAVNTTITIDATESLTPIEIVTNAANQVGLKVDSSKLEAFKKYFPERAEPYFAKLSPRPFQNTFGRFLQSKVFEFNRMSANIMNNTVYLSPNSVDFGDMIKNVDPGYIISATSNSMIGEPRPNPTGIDIVTLFNPNILPQDVFKLESHFYGNISDNGSDFFNMKYWIQNIQYDLETRGKNFYNRIVARRAGQ